MTNTEAFFDIAEPAMKEFGDYRIDQLMAAAKTESAAALDLVRHLARMGPPDERDEIAEVEGEIEAFSHMIRKAKEIVGGDAPAPTDPARDTLDWSGPEEGDTADLSVWITNGEGEEIVEVDSGDVERNKNIARNVVAKVNAMPWPLEHGIVDRLVTEAIAAEQTPNAPITMEDLIEHDAASRAADPAKAALQDCVGALSCCMDQIEQMRGMFDDGDGTIQDAMDAAQDAVTKAREVLA